MTKKRRSKKRKQEILRNKKLVKKYPWLRPKSVWTGKILKDYDYSYIEWGWSKGWDAAFGQMYLEELDEAVQKSGHADKFYIEQIKEKYGSARTYVSFYTDAIRDVINKYEYLSQNICICCGKPDVPMINTGWMSPECFDCFRKGQKRQENYLVKLGKEITLLTEEEIKQEYEDCIDEEPDENGEYKMTNAYTIRHWDKDSDEPVDEQFDISETADAIRRRWKKRMVNYDKRIYR